jgi:hypothetical protein
MLHRKWGSFFVHIPGAEHLLPVPLSNNLFSLEDGRLIMLIRKNRKNRTLKKPRRKKWTKKN